MAFSKLICAALTGGTFQLFGDGGQSRDFTYVSDVVGAMVAAAGSDFTGVANVGGGSRITMNDVLDIVTEVAGPPVVRRLPDQRATSGTPPPTSAPPARASATSRG